MHRASQRRSRALVRDFDGGRFRQVRGHDRRVRPEGRASHPGLLAQSRRAAVRLLPGRADHAGRGAVEAEARAHRQRHQRRDVRQPLPLRLLSAHRAGHPRRRQGSLTMTIRSELNPVIINVSRRGMLTGLAAGGLVLAARFPALAAPPFYPTGAEAMPNKTVSDPHVFIAIAPDGIVTIVAARAEMGTGAARTSLPMIVADELDADWSKVRIRQSEGDEVKYGNQDTDGSRSTRHFIQPMRLCGASMRLMLEQAAAKKWNVPEAECVAEHHEVIHKPSGRKAGYGELAADAAGLPVPPQEKVKLKEQAQFRYMGKGNVGLVDLFDITTGKAMYGQDVRLDGMTYAVIARPPVVGGKVASVDDSAALKVPGVEKIVKL